TGGVSLAVADLDGDRRNDLITGAGPGGGPHVKVFHDPVVLGNYGDPAGFLAYDTAFRGGVSVAGVSGVPGFHAPPTPGKIITAPGPGGGPHVKVFDAGSLAVTGSFLAYDPAFTGGVNVTAEADILVTAPASR